MNTDNEKLLIEELEFAKKQFAKIDKEIQLPASLSGAQLMKKMKEQQAQEAKPAKNNVIQWPKRIIPLAACFAVVIGIVAGYDRMFSDVSDVVVTEEAFEEAVVEAADEETAAAMPEMAGAGFAEEGAAAYSEEPSEYDIDYINESSLAETPADEELAELHSKEQERVSSTVNESDFAVTQQERNKRKNSNRKKSANKTETSETQSVEQTAVNAADEQFDDAAEEPAVMMLRSAMPDTAEMQSRISAFEEYSQLEAKLISTPSAAMLTEEASVAETAEDTLVFEATENGFNVSLKRQENGFCLNAAKNGEDLKHCADISGITKFNTLFIKNNKAYIIGTLEHEGVKTVKLFVCTIADNAGEGAELFAQSGDFYAAYMDESCLYILSKSSAVGNSGEINLPSYAVRLGETLPIDIKQIYYSEDISALDFITVSSINFSTENVEGSPKAIIASNVDVELNGVPQLQTNSGEQVCLQGTQISFK